MRSLWTALLLAFLTLSGCLNGELEDTTDDDLPTTDTASSEIESLFAPTFSQSVLLGSTPIHGVGFEPSVAVAPDGTIYVTTPGAETTTLVTMRVEEEDSRMLEDLPTWRSDDGGKTFRLLNDEDMQLIDETWLNGDAAIAIDDLGRVHLLGLNYGVQYVHSEDKGETWTAHGRIESPERDGSEDRQWIAAHGTDFLVATWRDGSGGGIMFTRSQDGGQAWIVQSSLQEIAGTTNVTHIAGPIEIGPSGNDLFIPHTQFDPEGNPGLHIMVSHDRGDTWQDVDMGHRLYAAPQLGRPLVGRTGLEDRPVALFPVAAADLEGNVYVTWSEHREDGGTWVAWSRSLDGGHTWSEASFLTPTQGNAVFPWIVAGDEGRIAITYLRSETDGDPEVGVHEWYVHAAMSMDATADIPSFADVLVTPDVVHMGAVCLHGGLCAANGVVAFDRSLADLIEPALTPDGDLAVAWTQTQLEDGRNPQVWFARQDGGSRLLAA